MRKFCIICSVLVFAVVISEPAYAYLDPGTGSVMLQSLLASIAAALGAIRLFWQRLKDFFRRGKKEQNNDQANSNDATDTTTPHSNTSQKQQNNQTNKIDQ